MAAETGFAVNNELHARVVRAEHEAPTHGPEP
jgi:hypothetical protein